MSDASPAIGGAEVDADDFADIHATVREFIRTKVVPREREIADGDAIPADLRQAAKDIGLFGFAIPQEWGGLGLDLAQDVELAQEFGYTCLALRSMFGTNNGIAGQVLVNFGTDEQKAQWLSKIASGDVVASFALTEPGAGSNPAGLRTKAVRIDEAQAAKLGIRLLKLGMVWPLEPSVIAEFSKGLSARSARGPPTCISTGCASQRRRSSAATSTSGIAQQ